MRDRLSRSKGLEGHSGTGALAGSRGVRPRKSASLRRCSRDARRCTPLGADTRAGMLGCRPGSSMRAPRGRTQLQSVCAALGCLSLLACGARTGLDESYTDGGRPPLLELSCPSGPDDPRLPLFELDAPASLDGTRFVSGDVRHWHWDLVREDCDAVVANPEFMLQGGETSRLTFQALRPSPYHFTLHVVGAAGDTGTCDFEVPTEGRGLRVELCWNTSQNTDLDLYLHNPFDKAPWYEPSAPSVTDGINGSTC